MAFFSYLHDQSDITDIIFREPKKYSPLADFTNITLRGKSPFTITQREIMATFVSGLNECSFCYGTHAAIANEFGVESALLESLLTDIDSAPIEESLKPIFHFIKKLTLTPSKMVEEDAARVYQLGWSEKALTDAINICALFNFYNRLLDGHGIKGNDSLFASGASYLVKRGYKQSLIVRLVKRFIIDRRKTN